MYLLNDGSCWGPRPLTAAGPPARPHNEETEASEASQGQRADKNSGVWTER